jgi:hypothetical protein
LEGWAAALDNVGWEDHWFDKNCERFGLKNFGGQYGPNVNNEEWHAQLVEYGNSKRGLQADRRNGKRHAQWKLCGRFSGQQPSVPSTQHVSMEDDDMKYLTTPERVYDSRTEGPKLAAKTRHKIPVSVLRGTVAQVNITAVATTGAGYLTVTGVDSDSHASFLNFDDDRVTNTMGTLAVPDGHLYVSVTSPCHLIVDLYAVGSTS